MSQSSVCFFNHTNFFFLKAVITISFEFAQFSVYFSLIPFPLLLNYQIICIFHHVYMQLYIHPVMYNFFFNILELLCFLARSFALQAWSCHPRFLCIVLLGIPFPCLFVRSLVTWVSCPYCLQFITLLVQCLQFLWGDREGVFL